MTIVGVISSLNHDGNSAALLRKALRGGKSASEKPDAMRRAHAPGGRIARDVRTKRTYPLQNLFGRMFHMVFLRPFFKKAAIGSKDGPMKGYTRI